MSKKQGRNDLIIDEDLPDIDFDLLDDLDNLPVIETGKESKVIYCLSDKELEIVKEWASVADLERPMLEDEKQLYDKLFGE
ncbi:hypothetical protein [Bacillus sp. UMB0728]|uniref:hypothetical protein n=1 Tax=Bacillus sp. UMB0728 TaxID=2066052 RepID=UPI000C78CCE9|nr:hypothetical protein [Bacillus sp. UMB0728]PLR72228.1 hypothetical protein CYJ37_11780 [Bacillus sp. UMB0728]